MRCIFSLPLDKPANCDYTEVMKHRSVLIYGKGEGMYTIAIVEDDKTQAASLKEYLLRYAAENGEAFAVKTFSNAVIFLEKYTAVYDVVFMDIKMPYLNGIAAAHKLRELDKGVLLFFITSLTQYAIRGYEVDALNYIVKPVEYNFSVLLPLTTFQHYDRV